VSAAGRAPVAPVPGAPAGGAAGAVDPDLRAVFRRHAAGVAAVTVAASHGPVGLLVTSVTSVSAVPALVSFNVSRRASSWPAIAQARHVGVHLLSTEQEELAVRFARSGEDRFAAPTVWRPGPRGVPLLEGCAAWLVGRVATRIAVADHHIVVVRMVAAGTAPDRTRPLVHHDGAFGRFSRAG
jgi:flavin reductase (DIM6/NTAB) family NADH-FMN oxidoreductase RutF